MLNELDLAPKSLDDCVISDARSRATLSGLIDMSHPFPAFGKCGIILHGPYGTGKTTLARLLPNLMDAARGGSGPYYDFHSCAQGANGAMLMTQIQTATSYVSLNAGGLHYTVLDEVDNLTEAAQASLKAIMTGLHGVFIMTTNHVERLNEGLVNRSHLIHMFAARPQDWLPLVKRVITACGSSLPPDQALLPVIASCNGSAREICTAAISVALTAQREGA